MWTDTKTINRYTKEPNIRYSFNDKSHCVVFKRKFGWAYTARIPLEVKRWVQCSSDTHGCFETQEEAKSNSLISMSELKYKLLK